MNKRGWISLLALGCVIGAIVMGLCAHIPALGREMRGGNRVHYQRLTLPLYLEMPLLGAIVPSGAAQTQQLPVVLVHGFCGNPDAWEQLRLQLREMSFRVGVIDLRDADGHTNGDIVTYAQDLNQYIVDNFPGEDISIVAHSMGGIISRYYITHYTNSVKKLVLLGTPNMGSKWISASTLANKLNVPVSTLGVNLWFMKQWNTFYECLTEDSPAASQLSTGSEFLTELNALSIPQALEVYNIIGRNNLSGPVAAGDGVVSVKNARLRGASLYQTLDDHGSYKTNQSTKDLIIQLLQAAEPLDAVNWTPFPYWPVSLNDEPVFMDALPSDEEATFLRDHIAGDFGFTANESQRMGVNLWPRGEQAVAVAVGFVDSICSDMTSSDGMYQDVILWHPDYGVYTRYYHLTDVRVARDASVSPGDLIGQYSSDDSLDLVTYPDFQVSFHGSCMRPRDPIDYLNPLTFYPSVNTDPPEISQVSVANQILLDPTALASVEGQTVSLGSQDVWLAFDVSTNDRDIDDVVIEFDNRLNPLHRFDYYDGTSKHNPSVFSRQAFAHTNGLDIGQPSQDWFYYHLYAPTDVAMQTLLEDGQPYTIHIRAYDVFGNMDEVSFQIELAQ